MRPPIPLRSFAGLVAITGLMACSGGSSTEPGGKTIVVPTAANANNVSIVVGASTLGADAFSPNPSNGSFASRPKVIWTNADRQSDSYGGAGVPHHLVSDTGLFDSGTLSVGESYGFTFPGAGTYSYHCSLHPSMVGTITLTQ